MKKYVALLLTALLMLGLFGTVSAESAAPTKLTLWTFIDQHASFYQMMCEKWNELNPDRQIELETTVIGYADMHDKFKIALQSGVGAPDICDVELGQFPNVLKGEPQLVVLNDYMADYMDDLVQSRLDIYAKGGNYYGVPTHVGATVAFYNVPVLEAAGIDYTEIVTWDDWAEAGRKLKEANPDVYMGNVETSTSWTTRLMLAALGSDMIDVTDPDSPVVTMDTPEMNKIATTLQGFVEEGLMVPCPGGQVDTEEGKGFVNSGASATVIMPLWYMSRFVDEIPDMNQQYAIAPAPVFEAGQPRSVGLGGTGTVVTLTAADIDLAAEFIVYAKISETGNEMIWEYLGFDPCNTAVWDNTELTHNPDNKYIQYFLTNPFDTLLEIRDEIMYSATSEISPTVNSYNDNYLWNGLYIDMGDVAEELETAQSTIESEIF